MTHRKFETRKPLKGRIRTQPSDKLNNLIYYGIIEPHNRFIAKVFTRYTFKVNMKTLYPRFGITKAQKMYNHLRQIKWDDLPPITIYLDDFEQAEDL